MSVTTQNQADSTASLSETKLEGADGAGASLEKFHQIEVLARLDIDELNEKFSSATPSEVLDIAIKKLFSGQIAMVSSFGAESAVLLHMVAQIDPFIPVIFVDTGKLFPETVEYRNKLAKQFGLLNVQTVGPEREDLLQEDPDGVLHLSDVDQCCDIRKVRPFERALKPYVAEISGRKRFQNEIRADLNFFGKTINRVKVNPLINWSAKDLADYVKKHDLPRHPLVALGYLSIGCAPCTSPVKEGEDPRAGRWRDDDKTECGIHFVDGKAVPIGK